MLHFAVCDDEKTEIEYLSILVSEWAKSQNTAVDISCFSSAESFLFYHSENKATDILLLDIQMNDMNGIELAEQLRREQNNLQIIFITGFPDYMQKGFDVSALHYLLKPIEKEKLFSVLTKAATNTDKADPFLLLALSDGQCKMKLSDILCMEANGHTCRVYGVDKILETKMSFSELSKKADCRFAVCHRSYLVNLQYVSFVNRTSVVLDSGLTIPLSRRLYADFNRAFIDYYRGK